MLLCSNKAVTESLFILYSPLYHTTTRTFPNNYLQNNTEKYVKIRLKII